MNYLIHQEKMDELNAIIGQQGGPATSAASDAMAKTQSALAAGDTATATIELNKAIEANKLDGGAWANAQRWHDKRINEDQYTGSEPGGQGGGTVPGPPAIPGNAIQMFRGGDGHLMTGDSPPKDITIPGKNYAAHVTGNPDGSAPWQYFKADFDGNWASMSCDGKQIAWVVADAPTDPGTAWRANTAQTQFYKAGQFCCFRIGGGGYYNDATAIFSIN